MRSRNIAMMNTQTKSLEWFFKTPSAANFPQAVASPALSALAADYSRMLDLFGVLGAGLPANDRAIWMEAVHSAQKVSDDLGSDFTAETAGRLVSVLQAVGVRLLSTKQDQNPDLDTALRAYRTVLADLVVYARESSDVSFKQKVLDLVRQFDKK